MQREEETKGESRIPRLTNQALLYALLLSFSCPLSSFLQALFAFIQGWQIIEKIMYLFEEKVLLFNFKEKMNKKNLLTPDHN